MTSIAIINQKGGSGKTTTAVNLAAALGEIGKRIMVIDLDPQGSASSWLGIREEGKGLFEAFTNNGNLEALVHDTSTPGVDLIPASPWLVGIEKAMAGEVGAEIILRAGIRRLPSRWDFIFMDCPPSLGFLAVSALVAAQDLIVPVEAHVMALQGLASLTRTIERVRERLNPDLVLFAILVCRVRRTNLCKEVIQRLRERFGTAVVETVIRENVRLAEAPSFGQPITLYDPKCSGAEDYRAAATEMLKKRRT